MNWSQHARCHLLLPCMQMQRCWNVCKDYGPLQLPATLRFSFSPAVQSQLRGLYGQCSSPDPAARPAMLEVVQQLDAIICVLVAEAG